MSRADRYYRRRAYEQGAQDMYEAMCRAIDAQIPPPMWQDPPSPPHRPSVVDGRCDECGQPATCCDDCHQRGLRAAAHEGDVAPIWEYDDRFGDDSR